MINLLDNTPNQPTKFRIKNWVERNDDSRGTCNTNSKIKFQTSMLRSSLCVIIVMPMYLFKELYQLQHKQETTQI